MGARGAAAIFGPFFAQVALTLAVWLWMYAKRLPFILRERLGDEALTPAELARRSPPDVARPSDNLKNLFELPVVFYALCLYLYVRGEVDGPALAAAWTFVAFRAAHSLVHVTGQPVRLRFALYVVSSIALWWLAARAAWHWLAA